MSSAQSAEVRHRPVQSNALEQALYKSSRLPQRQAEQNLQSQTGLNGGVTESLLPPSSTGGFRLPRRLRIKPDRKRSALLQELIVLRPVPGLVRRRCPAAHGSPLSRWIHIVNPCRLPVVQQSPTSPEQRAATKRSNPGRAALPLADIPRSSSMTSTVWKPYWRAEDTRWYCRRWLSRLVMIWLCVDGRT